MKISLVVAIRVILLFIIPIITYGIALLPPTIFLYFVIKTFLLQPLLLLLLPFILMLDYFILLFSLIFSSAFFINVFHLKYEEGIYEQNLKEKMYFKYNLYFILYYPVYRILNFIVYPPLKSFYLRLIGAKIGRRVFLSLNEIIFDPCLIEIGDGTMIGTRAMVLAHIGEEKLTLKKTKIGKNCIIGTEALIMPGVVIEDNIAVGAKSLVPKNAILKKGKIYAGIPVKEIGEKD
ncbi:MAG: hypothetical protein FE036_01735 [Thermoplasmata archaeon]|nr:MAG: hypothetical protein FE036_01735 [Thermoplasmata archaeon]